MSGFIPKEELAGFRRWQADSFDRPRPVAKAAPRPVAEPASPVEEALPPPVGINLPTAEDIERMHEEARASGYQAGYEEGRQAAEQAGREAASAQAEQLLALTGNLQNALAELDQNVADQLLGLATEIAAQIVCGAIAVKTDLLQPIIREAIAALPLHHSHLTLRLHPTDARHVKALMGEQLSQSGTQIIEDSEISPGGCLIRAGTSEVDATIETRWKRVIEAIGIEPRAWLEP